MLKLGPTRTIGTPVRCPSCRYPNLAIDIWCERCGRPLDMRRADVAPQPPGPPEPPEAPEPPKPRVLQAVAPVPTPRRQPPPRRTLPRITRPRWMTLPRLKVPQLSVDQLRLPVIPRIVWVVGLLLAVLVAVPLAYILLPSGQPAARGANRAPLPSTNAIANGAPEAAAIRAVEAKTGLKYSTKCASTTACLSISEQTLGKDAAAIVFTTAHTGGRQCVAYVYHKAGAWHVQDAACALPGQISPLVGHDATVHVPGSCANVRDAASLGAKVVTCLYDGATVHVEGGPTYADDFMWWHTDKGWMAHDFLVAP